MKRLGGEVTDYDHEMRKLGFVKRKLTDEEVQRVGESEWCYAWGGGDCPNDLVAQRGDKWLACSIFTFDSLHSTQLSAARHLRGAS